MENHCFETQFETVDSSTVIDENGKKLIVNHVDVEWNYVETADHVEGPNTDETNVLTIDSPEFKWLKFFLLGTLQKIPKRLTIKRYNFVLRIAQMILVLAAIAHYLYVIGVFRGKTLVKEETSLTLTTFKNVVWNFRNPLFTILGFLYFRKTHFDDLLRSINLRSSILQSVKRRIQLCCVLEIVFTVVLPASSQLLRMLFLPTHTEKAFPPKIAIMNTVFLVLARLVTLPIVITFIAVFYLLYFNVTQYTMKIQTWKVSRQQCKARNTFIDIQTQNKNAEKAFQPFMIIHIGILILIFIPGFLCYVERFRSEGTYSRTRYTEQPDKMYDPVVSVVRLGSDLTNLTNKQGSQMLLLIKIPKRKNDTTKKPQPVAEPHKENVKDEKAKERILLEALTFVCELLALYLPFILLGKINKALFHLPQTIRSLKLDEQRENEYLVQNREIKKEILEDFEPGFMPVEGLQVLGMKLTVVKTVFVALVAPLLTLLFHILVGHVDISS